MAKHSIEMNDEELDSAIVERLTKMNAELDAITTERETQEIKNVRHSLNNLTHSVAVYIKHHTKLTVARQEKNYRHQAKVVASTNRAAWVAAFGTLLYATVTICQLILILKGKY